MPLCFHLLYLLSASRMLHSLLLTIWTLYLYGSAFARVQLVMRIMGWTLKGIGSCQRNFSFFWFWWAAVFYSFDVLWGLASIRSSLICVHRTLSPRLQTGICQGWTWFQNPLLSAGLLPMYCCVPPYFFLLAPLPPVGSGILVCPQIFGR